MKTPKVTVLMPVYNSEKYLKEAIKSILNQTFQNFEFIIIDDGSTDKSADIIKDYAKIDKRIIFRQNQINIGLIKTLNNAIKQINTKYIARMDADDISTPNRLEAQISFIEQQQNIVSCGTWAKILGNESNIINNKIENRQIYSNFLFSMHLIHATSLTLTSLLKDIKYDKNYFVVEDYDLWERIIQKYKVANVPEVLYSIRKHSNNVSGHFTNIQTQNAKKVQKRQLQRLGIEPTIAELDLHYSLKHESRKITLSYLENIHHWLVKLKQANQKKQIYPEPEFTETLKEIWHKHTAGNSKIGLRFAKLYTQSLFSLYHSWTTWQKTKFWVKSFLKKS